MALPQVWARCGLSTLTLLQLLPHTLYQFLVGFFGNHRLDLAAQIGGQAYSVEQDVPDHPSPLDLTQSVVDSYLPLLWVNSGSFDQGLTTVYLLTAVLDAYVP